MRIPNEEIVWKDMEMSKEWTKGSLVMRGSRDTIEIVQNETPSNDFILLLLFFCVQRCFSTACCGQTHIYSTVNHLHHDLEWPSAAFSTSGIW